MKGTLQGDFTRLRFDPAEPYSGVRMQQGRVQLDADWNELVDLVDRRIRTGTTDLVGASGAPAAAAAFAVAAGDHGVELGTGGHSALVGGAEGFELPAEARQGDEGLTLEAAVVVRGDGPVLGLWARLATQRTFRLAWSLSVEGERLRWRRAGGLADLLSEPVAALCGHRRLLAVTSGPAGAVLRVDGERVSATGDGGDLPAGRLVLMVGTPQPPTFEGLLCDLRLRGPGGALLGEWCFGDAEEGVARIEDRGPLGNEARLRGGEGPPRRLPVDLMLGAGRYYVDGVLCHNPRRSSFCHQPDLPGAGLPQPAGRGDEHHVLYLDVWERSLSPAEDPGVLEPALGGADTVTRSRLVAQARFRPLDTDVEPAMRPIHDRWQPAVPPLDERGSLVARRRKPATVGLENALYRVEVHDEGDGATAAVAGWRGGALVLETWDDGWRVGQALELLPREGEEPRVAARVTGIDAEQRALHLDAGAAARNLSGSLRVRRGATFKWSRDNASVVFPVAGFDGGAVEIGSTARDLEGLDVGATVELADEATALGVRRPVLHRVSEVDPSNRRAVLEPPPRPPAKGERAVLRLWSQRGGGVEAARVAWQELESGVEVRFLYDAPYRAGDYWLVPARSITADVDWPTDGEGLPLPRPPAGVEHVSAPVALLSYRPGGYRLTDLRRTFLPHAVDAVRKQGDWMDGPLDVRADLAVQGDAEVAGRLRAEVLYGRLASDAAVGRRQIAAGAVTPRALAPEVGVVPTGSSLLSTSSRPPAGFVATGWVVEAGRAEPGWVDRGKMPVASPGPLVSVAVDGLVYALLESGEVWEYDPAGDTWQGRPGLPVPLEAFAATAWEGRIYVAGGVDAEGRRSGLVLSADPRQGSWVECAPLPTPRSHLALVACGGHLHALGGLRDAFLGPRASRRHEIYDPGIDTWSSGGKLRLPRAVVSPGAAAVGERIHLAGGEGRWLFGRWGDFLCDEHHVYRAGAAGWSRRLARLPSARTAPRLAPIYQRLAMVGGEGSFGWLAECDLYDPASDTWRPLPALHQTIAAPGVTAIDGTLHVTGAQRAAGRGVLMETCPVTTMFHVHRRVAPEEAVDEDEDRAGDLREWSDGGGPFIYEEV